MLVLRVIRETAGAVWATFQPALRFIAWLLFLVAVVTFVIDVTRWQLGMEGAAATPLSHYIKSFAPGSLAAFQGFVSKTLSPAVWQAIFATALDWAPWISFSILAGLLSWLGQRRERVRVYIN